MVVISNFIASTLPSIDGELDRRVVWQKQMEVLLGFWFLHGASFFALFRRGDSYLNERVCDASTRGTSIYLLQRSSTYQKKNKTTIGESQRFAYRVQHNRNIETIVMVAVDI